jgi:hypothetical protein
MDSNLEDKRKELFELHKQKLGTDKPLMRKQAPVSPMPEQKPQNEKAQTGRKNKMVIGIIGVTSVIVVIELVFLAKELGWFK